jgi:hypothetical protein
MVMHPLTNLEDEISVKGVGTVSPKNLYEKNKNNNNNNNNNNKYMKK